MKKFAVLFVLLGLVLAPVCARAAEGDTMSLRTHAVQNRLHSNIHEFTGFFGVLPLDAFTKGLTFTGAYTIHFNEFIAWEVGQFTYSTPIDTDLKKDLAELPQPVGPTPFERVRYFATSSLIVKPIYGKLAVINKHLIFGELFLLAGAGYGWLSITGRPVASVGGGFRVYANQYVSFRFDIRDNMFFNLDDLKNELWLGLGISLSFG